MTVSRHDRFGAVIAAGQRITQARLADEVRTALSDSARALLGAERCSIIDHADGEADAPLVSAAFRSGHLVVWPADDATIQAPASGPPGVRCALCAPIPVSGGLAAVLYATHSVEAAFGDDARAIAAFLVGLAGAALDSAAARSR
ncbi:MAG TPA: GAF domain-containing protein, partial [Kofleriaceae bacterium]